MTDAATTHATALRTVFLTRDGDHFRLAFDFDRSLVDRVKAFPYAEFSSETRSWTTPVCAQSLDALRTMFAEGLCDVAPDDLLRDGERPAPVAPAVLRRGSAQRPFRVQTGVRDDRLYSRLRTVPGASWDKGTRSITYPPTAAAALGELVDRGVVADPDGVLSPADVSVSFDGRNGTFSVRGDRRAQVAFDKYFPRRDVVAAWQERGIDAAFADAFSEEIYRGEIARHAPEVPQPSGLSLPLFDYQAHNVAVALERTGVGVFDAPGLGKCCVGDTRLWVNGTTARLDELWDTQSTEPSFDGVGEWALPKDQLRVHATGADGKIRNVDISRLYRQQVREDLRQISLDVGSEITVTAAHRFLTSTGWTNNLAVGDRIAVPRQLTWPGEEVDPDLVVVLAWQIAEGHEDTRVVRVTQKDREVLERVRRCFERIAERYGLQLNTMPIKASRATFDLAVSSHAWIEFLKARGYSYGERSAHKAIPDFLMQGDTAAVRLFLREYFSAEGSVNPGQRGVEITSASEMLMEQLRQLLLRFGIQMRVVTKWKGATNGRNIRRPYRVGLITGESMRAFNTHVGFSDPTKQSALEAIAAYPCRTNLETVDVGPLLNEILGHTGLAIRHLGVSSSAGIPGRHLSRSTAAKAIDAIDALLSGAAERRYVASGVGLGRDGARWHARTVEGFRRLRTPQCRDTVRALRDQIEWLVEADLGWATITSIDEIHHDGYVYDIEVPGDHNYVANGIVCHNTASGIALGHELVVNRGEVARTVVVCPSTLRSQWSQEITRFTGADDVVVVDGTAKKRLAAYEAAAEARWVVVHWDVLARDLAHLEPLARGALVVFDEAHRAKDHTRKRTKAAVRLAKLASRRLTLTGTPVVNRPDEWYAVLNLAVPGCLGAPLDFMARYMHKGRFGGYEGAKNLDELRRRSMVHFIRHTKDQVATHLPPLRVEHQPLDPTPRYASLLRRVHRDARDEIRDAALERAGRRPGADVLNGYDLEEVATGAEMTATGMLRLLCSSPRLLQASDSAAAETLISAGLVPDEDGPKLDWLRARAAEWQQSGERAVVFTFSRRMADLIAERLGSDGIRYVLYTGSTKNRDRDAAVTAFTTPGTDDDPGPTCFIATDAAAEGLNLGRCCSLLVNVDVPWQPMTLEQRSNRIHRVDGTHPHYLVVNLTIAGTMEEGLVRMISAKVDLADTLLGEEGGRQRTVGRRRRQESAGRNSFLEAALEEHFSPDVPLADLADLDDSDAPPADD